MTLEDLLTKKIKAISDIQFNFRNKELPKFYKDKLFNLIFEINYLNDYINLRKEKEVKK